MKIRKTLAVGIAAVSITAGVAAPAQAEATTPQTAQTSQVAQVAQAAQNENTPSTSSSLFKNAPAWVGWLLAPAFLVIYSIHVLTKGTG